MNHEENDSEYEKGVNEERRNVVHDERPDPDENHQNREQQEYKPHKKSSFRRFGWFDGLECYFEWRPNRKMLASLFFLFEIRSGIIRLAIAAKVMPLPP